MSVKFTISLDDIKNGFRLDPYRCPVALALRNKLDLSLGEVTVKYTGIWCNETRYKTPRPLKIFMRKFDFGDPVEPSVFVLRA